MRTRRRHLSITPLLPVIAVESALIAAVVVLVPGGSWWAVRDFMGGILLVGWAFAAAAVARLVLTTAIDIGRAGREIAPGTHDASRLAAPAWIRRRIERALVVTAISAAVFVPSNLVGSSHIVIAPTHITASVAAPAVIVRGTPASAGSSATPIVRGATAPTTTTASPPAPSTTEPIVRTGRTDPTTASSPAAPNPLPSTAPSSRPEPTTVTTTPTAVAHHVVRPGESLWTIARDALAAATGRTPSNAAIVPYWDRVVAVNHATLRSGNPNLIYPGEVVALPERTSSTS